MVAPLQQADQLLAIEVVVPTARGGGGRRRLGRRFVGSLTCGLA